MKSKILKRVLRGTRNARKKVQSQMKMPRNFASFAVVLFFVATLILPALRNSQAETNYLPITESHFSSQEGQKYYIYLKKGEKIFAEFHNTEPLVDEITFTVHGPNGFKAEKKIPTGSPIDTLAKFDNWPVEKNDRGTIWMIDVATQKVDVPHDFTIFAEDATGKKIAGRVFSDRYMILQRNVLPRVTSGFLADFELWATRDDGYRYKISYKGYDGYGSVISFGGLGNLIAPGICESAFKSIPVSESNRAERLNDCGSQFKLWFAEPDPTLPESARMFDGSETWLYSENHKEAKINHFAFYPKVDDQYSGEISAQIENYYGSGLKLIATDGNWVREIPARNKAGKIVAEFDGRDAKGKEIPLGTKIIFTMDLDQPGMIHNVLQDVENLKGGIEFTRLNGSSQGRSDIFWDNSDINLAARCGEFKIGKTEPIANLKGVDSTGGVHAWTICQDPRSANQQPLGDNMLMDFWSYDRFAKSVRAETDFIAREIPKASEDSEKNRYNTTDNSLRRKVKLIAPNTAKYK